MTISAISSSIKHFYVQVRDFIFLILKHNIFFHSSAMSYYAALAIAPFLLILLQIGALLGNKIQTELITQTYFVMGPEVGSITEMIFNNANQLINLASISGIIGVATLLFTASIFFIQLRFSLDSIYGHHDPEAIKPFFEVVKERIFSMGFVIGAAILFIASMFVSNIMKYFIGTEIDDSIGGQIFSLILSFLMNMMIFTAIYYFAPSRTPKVKSALMISVFTSIAFLIGKILLGYYFKNVALGSVYGAAGTLLVFLVWAYYSSFTVFLSLEGYLFLHPEESESRGKLSKIPA